MVENARRSPRWLALYSANRVLAFAPSPCIVARHSALDLAAPRRRWRRLHLDPHGFMGVVIALARSPRSCTARAGCTMRGALPSRCGCARALAICSALLLPAPFLLLSRPTPDFADACALPRGPRLLSPAALLLLVPRVHIAISRPKAVMACRRALALKCRLRGCGGIAWSTPFRASFTGAGSVAAACDRDRASSDGVRVSVLRRDPFYCDSVCVTDRRSDPPASSPLRPACRWAFDGVRVRPSPPAS